MAIVQGLDGIVSTSHVSTPAPVFGVDLYRGRVEDYAAIYRTQPNVRLVVRFLARNIAQLGLHAYRRVSATERVALESTHPLAAFLKSPFPAAPKPPSRFRYIRTLVEDLCIFDNFYALSQRPTPAGRLNSIRIPPQNMRPEGSTFVGPTAYRLLGTRSQPIYAPADVFHLFGHNASDVTVGTSPLEALRRVLAEDNAAGEYREQFWHNAARIPGVLKRPLDAPKWSETASKRFGEDWRAKWSGSSPEAGGTPILEEGMDFTPTGFSAKDSEYLGARRLSREESAALYHVSPAFVGILENANFANMREQHVGLYVDTLGPWCGFIEDEFEAQMLPHFADVDDVYVEFSIEEKLRGNFEEQASAIQSSTGAPWMTRNEARALRNLPHIEGGDDLVVPLNVLVGGQASPTDSAPPQPGSLAAGDRPRFAHRCGDGTKTGFAPVMTGWAAKHEEVLSAFFTRQRTSVISRLGARQPLETAFDSARWNAELRDDLLALAASMAEDLGGQEAQNFGGTFDLDVALPWLTENARIAGELINSTTLAELGAAIGVPRTRSRKTSAGDPFDDLDGVDYADDTSPDDPTDPVSPATEVFALAVGARTAQIAASRVTSVGQWSRREGAEQSGAGSKTWNVNASPSRHAALDGETVPIRDVFSNGASWPGDPVLGSDETAGCLCSLSFGQ